MKQDIIKAIRDTPMLPVFVCFNIILVPLGDYIILGMTVLLVLMIYIENKIGGT